jgi:hypothetical protein
MTKVVLTKNHQSAPKIQQSRLKRDWMDETHKKHAYQCLPMTNANVNGWELVLEEDLVVQWSGGNNPVDVISGGEQGGRQVAFPSIIGIISIGMGWTINTEEGYSLWLTGSPNYFVDGAVPLAATIPSSWWPDEVQMNWKITKVGEPVTFPAGSPFCFFNIYYDSLMPSVEFEVENLWDKPDLIESRVRYSDMKMKNQQDNPWTWTKGIKSGIDADGNRIGPGMSSAQRLPAIPDTIQ